jgi:membrane-associated phospholipid phosphatase
VIQDKLAPGACRWCGANGLDTSVRDALLWSDPGRAAALSNVTAYVLAPIAALGLPLFDDAPHLADDAIPVLEAVVAGQLVTQVVKLSVGRQRPYAHFATGAFASSSEDNLSFSSGHTSIAFAFAVGAGTVAHARHARLEPVIWASGLAIAATTAYLRIAADKHWLTDTLGGAAIGSAAGYIVPRLARSLPEMEVVPTRSGIAVVGRF